MTVESRHHQIHRPRWVKASMRPRFFDRGKDANWTTEVAAVTASMRPRFFDRGKDAEPLINNELGYASMRPRFFDRGKGGGLIYRRTKRTLQ